MTDLIRTIPLNLKIDHLEANTLPASVRRRAAVKRTLDVMAALVGLVLVLPVMLLIALLVKLSSPGTVLFKQTRVGAGGRTFKILKFRTMVSDAEAHLAADEELKRLHLQHNFKLPADVDPRVTRIGAFLRRTSLDELPQLLNVLRGDMSLVGVRPVVPAEAPRLYGHYQSLYTQMRPGLTGYWQVNGRSTVTDEARVELDVHYLRNWSLKLDAEIILRTLPALLTRHGAH